MSDILHQEEFRHDRIDHALRTSLTNRSFNAYIESLGINETDLGKRVLDLGSGRAELFARTAAEKGIEVFSLNPQLSEQTNRDNRLMRIVEDNIKTKDIKKTVAALAQSLPFKPETFDTVVSLWAVPIYIPYDDMRATLQELLRVLKPGGKAFLGPVRVQQQHVANILNDLEIPFTFEDYKESGLVNPTDEYKTLKFTKRQ